MRIIRRVVPGRVSARTAAAVAAAVGAVGLAVGLPLGLTATGHSKAGVGLGALAPGPGNGLAPGPGPDSTAVGETTTTSSTVPTKVSVVPGVAYPGVAAESPSGGVVTPTPTAVPKKGAPATTVTTDPAQAHRVWSAQTLPPGTGKIRAVSCPDSSTCWAAGDGGIVATNNGGASWTAESTPSLSSGDYLDGVSCLGRGTCWATSRAGRMFHRTDFGPTWAEQPVPAPAGDDGFYGISCVDTGHCIAAGAGSGWLASTSDGGNTWTTSTACHTCNLLSISCVSATTCWAGGTESSGSPASPGVPVIYATSDGGKTWIGQDTRASTGGATGSIRSVSCSTATDCTAVGDYTGTPSLILSTTDAGANWTQSRPPAGVVGLTAVACVADAACWAAGNSYPGSGASVITRPSAGAPWDLDGQAASATFDAISCPGTGRCWAAGSAADPSAGAVFASTDA